MNDRFRCLRSLTLYVYRIRGVSAIPIFVSLFSTLVNPNGLLVRAFSLKTRDSSKNEAPLRNPLSQMRYNLNFCKLVWYIHMYCKFEL